MQSLMRRGLQTDVNTQQVRKIKGKGSAALPAKAELFALSFPIYLAEIPRSLTFCEQHGTQTLVQSLKEQVSY